MSDQPIPYTASVRLRDDVLTEQLDDERVFVDLESSEYFSSNRGGDVVWKMLAKTATIQDAYDGLLDAYDVEPEQLRRELDTFLGRLLEAGLIELVEEE